MFTEKPQAVYVNIFSNLMFETTHLYAIWRVLLDII